MKHDVAGDPMTGVKWTRRTTRKIAQELFAAGIHVSSQTVARILKNLNYSLRVNHKKVSLKRFPATAQTRSAPTCRVGRADADQVGKCGDEYSCPGPRARPGTGIRGAPGSERRGHPVKEPEYSWSCLSCGEELERTYVPRCPECSGEGAKTPDG